MTMPADLTDLFAPPATLLAPPSQAVRYRQGTVITFDQNTLENTVNVGGTIFTNLPLLGVGEAQLLDAGSVVGILVVGEATKTMFIAGRIVTPNTPGAAEAVGLMSSNTKAAFATDTFTATTSVYTAADNGPDVTITVRASGRILAFWSAQLDWDTGAAAVAAGGGAVSVALTGANTALANSAWSLSAARQETITAAHTLDDVARFRAAYMYLFEDLNPGATRFECQYKAVYPSSSSCDFTDRTIAVIAL